jgi:hypothetical protein
MKHLTAVHIAFLIWIISGCSSADTSAADFRLSTVLQGNWLVEPLDGNEDRSILGTLTLDANSYRFAPTEGAAVPSSWQERFCFIEQPAGVFTIEYQPNAFPDEDVRTFESGEILLTASFGCGDSFLIRTAQAGQELYFHSVYSEIQFYNIHKSYDNQDASSLSTRGTGWHEMPNTASHPSGSLTESAGAERWNHDIVDAFTCLFPGF